MQKLKVAKPRYSAIVKAILTKRLIDDELITIMGLKDLTNKEVLRFSNIIYEDTRLDLRLRTLMHKDGIDFVSIFINLGFVKSTNVIVVTERGGGGTTLPLATTSEIYSDDANEWLKESWAIGLKAVLHLPAVLIFIRLITEALLRNLGNNFLNVLHHIWHER
ncbi:hypothetical protein CHS0354_020992 [Potamilus streckersoni]|uniref:Uncharacterized protein n=1 Tax=Potamilus streckersoni TaxID=2493646 RepID=A0AAE0RUB7_9BIVA|nr:hypothetical protein CHS0354_020992 [Potamilus streckersoni]